LPRQANKGRVSGNLPAN